MVQQSYLGRSRERSLESQVPNRAILHLGQIFWDLHIHRARLLINPIDNLAGIIELDRVQVSHWAVVQPDTVLIRRVLGQRIGAVRGWLAVEAEMDSIAGCDCGVVGDALVDVDTGVVTLSPCYS